MAFQRLSLAILILSVAAAVESRLIHRINRRSLLDPTSLCENAEFPKLCHAIAETLPASSPQSLAEAAVKAAAAAAKAALASSAAAELAASQDTDKVTASCLSVCQQNFDDTVSDLEAGLRALSAAGRGSHDDAMTYLSAAVSDTETCNDTFDEEPGLANPVEHVNFNLQKLVKNSIALAAALN